MASNRAAIGALTLALTCGCQVASHADDFSVRESREPFQGVCNACPPSELDIRRPPCPVDSSEPDDGNVYTYVWRHMRLGAREEEWSGPNSEAYDIGLDLDCSTRPSGLPARCTPRELTGALPEEIPWTPLPHGIDNAAAQRVFSPLIKKSGGLIDFEAQMSESVDAGGSTIGVTLTQWNGTANDPRVNARMFSIVGISPDNGGPPRWDGNDLWDVATGGPDPDFPGLNIPDVTFKTNAAYVANGVLVADLSHLGVSSMVLMNKGARLEVQLHDLLVLANVTTESLTPVIGVGKWFYEDMSRSQDEFADFLSGCNPGIRSILDPLLPDLIAGAMDLPTNDDAPIDAPCEAMSVGYGADAFPARVGGYRSPSALPGCGSAEGED